ncbi:O-antigen ligase family protein [Blastococcus tunisiensis]|nr:O-antigen ligase family protein [Blastococcus sp. DSM 46838]
MTVLATAGMAIRLGHLQITAVAPVLALGLLAFKPLIDLFWGVSFGEVLGQTLNLQTVAALALIGLAVVALIQVPRPVNLPEAAAFALCGVAAVSCLVSSTTSAIAELLRLLAALAAVFVSRIVFTTPEHLRRLIRLFVASTAVPVVLALLQAAGFLSFQRQEWQAGAYVGRASGLYEHPINLVLFLVMAIPGALYLLAVERGTLRRVAYVAFLACGGAALLLTTHRAGLVAGALVLVGWFLLSRRPRLIAVALGGLALLVVVLWSQLAALFHAALASPTFLRGRGPIWTAFVDGWLDGGPAGWLLGSGFPYVTSDVPLLGSLVSEEPHNDFLRVLVTYGIAGLTCYLLLLGSITLSSWRLVRHGSGEAALIGRAVVLVVLAVVVLSLTAEPLRYPSGTWLLLALGTYVAGRGPTSGQDRSAVSSEARASAQELHSVR